MHLRGYVKRLHSSRFRKVNSKVKLIVAFLQLSDNIHPPQGYRFVPKGDVYVTRHWYGTLRN